MLQLITWLIKACRCWRWNVTSLWRLAVVWFEPLFCHLCIISRTTLTSGRLVWLMRSGIVLWPVTRRNCTCVTTRVGPWSVIITRCRGAWCGMYRCVCVGRQWRAHCAGWRRLLLLLTVWTNNWWTWSIRISVRSHVRLTLSDTFICLRSFLIDGCRCKHWILENVGLLHCHT